LEHTVQYKTNVQSLMRIFFNVTKVVQLKVSNIRHFDLSFLIVKLIGQGVK